jgi:hypothetical protein
MNFVNKFILHTKKNVTSWKKINTEMQGFKRGSPIKPHVKMGPLVTHPARVADFEDSSFRSICTSHLRVPCNPIPWSMFSARVYLGYWRSRSSDWSWRTRRSIEPHDSGVPTETDDPGWTMESGDPRRSMKNDDLERSVEADDCGRAMEGDNPGWANDVKDPRLPYCNSSWSTDITCQLVNSQAEKKR